MTGEVNRERTGVLERRTGETRVSVRLDLDGRDAPSDIETGLGFLDHMLAAWSLHAGLAATVRARGDLEVDDHHTVEDCGLAVGGALREALGDRSGIRRFGSAFAPLDEALARAVIDVSGRPHASVDLGLRRERLGDVATENLTHFFQSLATAAGWTVHVDVLRGENDHHRAEAAFKAFALATREAVARVEGGEGDDTVPSTKGVLG